MKNFVFISPNFPTNYWKFCRQLKNNGLNVLGIGDQPYDELKPELKDSLTEYYKVSSMENYDEVHRAVAFFIHKYGRIDWLESNNEYWLVRDAQLRTDFNITSGFQEKDMDAIKYKSKMKKNFKKAGLPVARYHIADNLPAARRFMKKVGYPAVAKPDNGVGAEATYKLTCDEDLVNFFETYDKNVTYIMEEYVNATVNSYDAIIDSNGEPVFENGNVTVLSLMDVVNNHGNSIYYQQKELPEDIVKAGRATVKAFGVKSRFVHLEYFRLNQDQEGLGKEGDLVGLEVNMRPPGGFTPDLHNFSCSTDVYKIWADMIAFDKTDLQQGEQFYCAFMGRRDGKNFVLSHEELAEKYKANMKMQERIPDALSGAMGNQMFVANFSTKEEMDQFYYDACLCHE